MLLLVGELVGQVSGQDVLGVVPPVGGVAGGLYALHLLLKRWDERDARNVAELWELVGHYRERAERAEALVQRYGARYGPLTSEPS